VSFATITLCVTSQQVFIVVVYFIIDSSLETFGYTLVQVKNMITTPTCSGPSV